MWDGGAGFVESRGNAKKKEAAHGGPPPFSESGAG
jgi:hypothetical protein